MPALDAIHDAVKHALQKDGWTITSEPEIIRYAEFTLLADMAAERPFAAERNGAMIVVEAKSFSGRSAIQEFKLALGQYLIYRTYLEETSPDQKLYLAIPEGAYLRFFAQEAVKVILRRFEVALLVVDTIVEEVVTWTS